MKNSSSRLRTLLRCLVIGLVIGSMLLPSTARAISSAALNAIRHNTPSYGGDDAECSPAAGDTSLVGNGAVQQAMNYFVNEKGLTAPQAAGLVGNLLSESAGTMNPSIVQGGSTAAAPTPNVGYGLAQWTSPGRQQNLVNFAQQENLPVNNLKLQLDFIWQELSTSYKDSTLTPLQAATGPQDAAVIVMVNYEAPADHDPNGPNAHARSTNAVNVLTAYGAQTGDGSSPAPAATTTESAASTSTGCQSPTTTQQIVVTGDCPISSTTYGNVVYSPAQLQKEFGAPSSNLVDVTEWGFSTKVNKVVAACLDATVKQIQAENIAYKVTQFGCYRYDTFHNLGDSSYHSYGAACDLNWNTNGYAASSHDMPQSYIDAFAAHGFFWGGNWSPGHQDWMHFEWHGIQE